MEIDVTTDSGDYLEYGLWSCGLWCCAIWYIDANKWEESEVLFSSYMLLNVDVSLLSAVSYFYTIPEYTSVYFSIFVL
jgi:hypothetical protein